MEEKVIPHINDNLDEEMNLMFSISSSHFYSKYFNDTLQCKTSNPYSSFINHSVYPISYLSVFPFEGQ